MPLEAAVVASTRQRGPVERPENTTIEAVFTAPWPPSLEALSRWPSEKIRVPA